MNKFLTVRSLIGVGLCLGTLGSVAMAQNISIDSLRRQVEVQRITSSDLATKCDQIDSVVEQKRERFKALAQQILSLNANQTPQVVDALKSLDEASKILDMAKTDCLNGGVRNSSILLEMFLLHVDYDLMELKYGVGQDLKKFRN